MINTRKVGIVGATKSIREFLIREIPDMNTDGIKEKITYVDGYLKIKKYEDKLANMTIKQPRKDVEIDSNIPFVLIRAGKWKQTIDNGITDRVFKISIRIVTKNKDEDGYQEITELADAIVEKLTCYPSLTGGYALDTDTITGGIEDDLCVGHYWTYVIEINARLPVAKPRILETLGYI